MSDPNDAFPTIIGPDAFIKGEMKFDKGLRLQGKFEGQIESNGVLLVAEGAKLKGDVKAGSIRIDGTISGNLVATDKVQLSSTAQLEGDLRTARLEVADGAMFVGQVAVGPQNGSAKAATSAAAATPAPSKSGTVRSNESKRSTPEPAVAGKR